MTTEEIRDLIDETIDGEALALYLSAEHGDRFGVYPDGSVAVGEGIGDEIDPEERPVVWVECPGIGNLDMGYYRTGLEGQEDMTDREVIAASDLSDEIDDFRVTLKAACEEVDQLWEQP
jgi:hypothetical protein